MIVKCPIPMFPRSTYSLSYYDFNHRLNGAPIPAQEKKKKRHVGKQIWDWAVGK